VFSRQLSNANLFSLREKFGQVPVIIHGDFVVYESRAIARYIDRIASPTSGKQLLPLDDLQKTALIEQWLSVDHDNLQPALKDVVAEKYHWYCPTENAEVLKAAQTKLLAFFDVFEVHFAKNKYFVGDNITLAGTEHHHTARHTVVCLHSLFSENNKTSLLYLTWKCTIF
jgi:glutathione S-transferase